MEARLSNQANIDREEQVVVQREHSGLLAAYKGVERRYIISPVSSARVRQFFTRKGRLNDQSTRSEQVAQRQSFLLKAWLHANHLGPSEGIAEPAAGKEVGYQRGGSFFDGRQRLSTLLVKQKTYHEAQSKWNISVKLV